MEENISWDYQTPGISFSEKSGRIFVFKKTLELLGFPAYYRFLLDPDGQRFAVQSCEMDDEGSHKLPKLTQNNYCEINSLALVKFIYKSCRWDGEISYRIPGQVVPNHNLVRFDLNKALEIHDGRPTVQSI